MKKALLLLILMSTLKSYSTENDTIKDNIRDRNSVSFSLTGIPSGAYASGIGILGFGMLSEYTLSYFFINNFSFNLTYSYNYQNNIIDKIITYENRSHSISPSIKCYFDKRRNFHFELVYYNGLHSERFLDTNYTTDPIKINSAGIGFGYSHLVRKNLGCFNNKLELTAYYKQLLALNKDATLEDVVSPIIFQIGIVYNL